jgi:hypothetical protein
VSRFSHRFKSLQYCKGNVIFTLIIVISASFGVEITNNSANLNCYLLFPYQIVQK